MAYYNPYSQNSRKLTYKKDELTYEPREAGQSRKSEAFSFDIVDHQGFEKKLDLGGIVNSESKVFASISEIGMIQGKMKPFQGAAGMEIHNVVPHDSGIVIVRGVIGWDKNLNARISLVVFD